MIDRSFDEKHDVVEGLLSFAGEFFTRKKILSIFIDRYVQYFESCLIFEHIDNEERALKIGKSILALEEICRGLGRIRSIKLLIPPLEYLHDLHSKHGKRTGWRIADQQKNFELDVLGLLFSISIKYVFLLSGKVFDKAASYIISKFEDGTIAGLYDN